ncbi:MAG: cation:proton antiporter [Gammaproteobacteria bacterium]
MSVAAAAFVMVMLLTVLRWPTIPAYFIAGVVTGPSVAGVLHNNDTAHFIAELGVIFLLFTIGLKFSLGALRTIRRYVFWLGGAQTTLTALLFGAPAWFLTGDPTIALLVGSIAAMSSTAVVSQILIDDNILTSPAGNRAMGVLLFQDLAVIPLIVIFSAGDGGASVLHTTAAVAVKVACIMAIVLFAGAPLMSRWLNFVAGYGGKELYMLNLVMLIGLLSGLSALSGLSYALGAFVAGILMSETLHRHRVSRIVEPFRHIFLGFFFMSLGVLVNPQYLAENWAPVLAAAAVIVAVKAPLVYMCARMLGTHAKTAIYASLLLCGAGEFGFVLLTLSRTSGIIEDSLFQLLLSANLIALIVVPFLWRKREWFTRLLAGSEWLTEAKKITDNLSQTANLSGHVVICGFGRTGQAISGILRELSLPYVALEENYQILQTVGGADNVIYAEASGADGLVGANITRARVLIVSYIDSVDSAGTVRRARKTNPHLLIVARADTAQFADELLAAGADDVYVDAHELGFSAAKLLAEKGYGADGGAVARAITRARTRENPFFTGEFGGGEDDDVPSAERFAGCIARREIPFLDAELDGCRVISWIREGDAMDATDVRRPARIGDEFVLGGDAAKLAAVKARLENAGE